MDIDVTTLLQMAKNEAQKNPSIIIKSNVDTPRVGRTVIVVHRLINTSTGEHVDVRDDGSLLKEADAISICERLGIPVTGVLARKSSPVSMEEFQRHLKTNKVNFSLENNRGVRELVLYKGPLKAFARKAIRIPIGNDQSTNAQLLQEQLFCDCCVVFGIPLPDKLKTSERDEYSDGLTLLHALPEGVRFAPGANRGLRIVDPTRTEAEEDDQSLMLAEGSYYMDYSNFGSDGVEPEHYDYSNLGTDGAKMSVEPSEALRATQVMGVAPSPAWIRASPRRAFLDIPSGGRPILAGAFRGLSAARNNNNEPLVVDLENADTVELQGEGDAVTEILEFTALIAENSAERGDGERKTQEQLWKEHDEMHSGDEDHHNGHSDDGDDSGEDGEDGEER